MTVAGIKLKLKKEEYLSCDNLNGIITGPRKVIKILAKALSDAGYEFNLEGIEDLDKAVNINFLLKKTYIDFFIYSWNRIEFIVNDYTLNSEDKPVDMDPFVFQVIKGGEK